MRYPRLSYPIAVLYNPVALIGCKKFILQNWIYPQDTNNTSIIIYILRLLHNIGYVIRYLCLMVSIN